MKFALLFVFAVLSCNAEIKERLWQSTDVLSIRLFDGLKLAHPGNIVYCTISLQTILALIAQGAKGETAHEIKNAIQLNFSDEIIRKDFKSYYEDVEAVKSITYNTANKIYLADNIKIKPDFLKIAVEDFHSGVENVDFKQAKATADKINAWVEEKTHQKIKGLVKENQINDLTRVALVNAVYLRGKFAEPFNLDATEKRDFQISEKETIQVDTMTTTQRLLYGRSDKHGISMIRLPLENPDSTFIIVKSDKIEDVPYLEEHLINIWKYRNFTTQRVQVFLPKFRIESSYDLIPSLKSLGVKKLFNGADLSGISNENLEVSTIAQKTVIDVNEEGIEAAAATIGLAVNRVEIQEEKPIVFKVDHPCVYAVDYKGVIVVSGRLSNPSQS